MRYTAVDLTNWVQRSLRPDTRIVSMALLIHVLITFLVIILCLYLVNMLPLDGRAKQIVRVIIILIGILDLLRALGALTVF